MQACRKAKKRKKLLGKYNPEVYLSGVLTVLRTLGDLSVPGVLVVEC
jgi:hypothetical protein